MRNEETVAPIAVSIATTYTTEGPRNAAYRMPPNDGPRIVAAWKMLAFHATAFGKCSSGTSYVVYGPLANGTTSLMYEGAPNFPEPDRFWRIVEKYGVTILYTAPTAIRAFMKWGPEWPKKHDLSSLRLLGTVGEPINPEAWMWYNEFIGGKRCPIVDTWWQTETGGILITPLPGATPTKPGSATLPFFGILPEVVDDYGKAVPR